MSRPGTAKSSGAASDSGYHRRTASASRADYSDDDINHSRRQRSSTAERHALAETQRLLRQLNKTVSSAAANLSDSYRSEGSGAAERRRRRRHKPSTASTAARTPTRPHRRTAGSDNSDDSAADAADRRRAESGRDRDRSTRHNTSSSSRRAGGADSAGSGSEAVIRPAPAATAAAAVSALKSASAGGVGTSGGATVVQVSGRHLSAPLRKAIQAATRVYSSSRSGGGGGGGGGSRTDGGDERRGSSHHHRTSSSGNGPIISAVVMPRSATATPHRTPKRSGAHTPGASSASAVTSGAAPILGAAIETIVKRGQDIVTSHKMQMDRTEERVQETIRELSDAKQKEARKLREYVSGLQTDFQSQMDALQSRFAGEWQSLNGRLQASVLDGKRIYESNIEQKVQQLVGALDQDIGITAPQSNPNVTANPFVNISTAAPAASAFSPSHQFSNNNTSRVSTRSSAPRHNPNVTVEDEKYASDGDGDAPAHVSFSHRLAEPVGVSRGAGSGAAPFSVPASVASSLQASPVRGGVRLVPNNTSYANTSLDTSALAIPTQSAFASQPTPAPAVHIYARSGYPAAAESGSRSAQHPPRRAATVKPGDSQLSRSLNTVPRRHLTTTNLFSDDENDASEDERAAAAARRERRDLERRTQLALKSPKFKRAQSEVNHILASDDESAPPANADTSTAGGAAAALNGKSPKKLRRPNAAAPALSSDSEEDESRQHFYSLVHRKRRSASSTAMPASVTGRRASAGSPSKPVSFHTHQQNIVFRQTMNATDRVQRATESAAATAAASPFAVFRRPYPKPAGAGAAPRSAKKSGVSTPYTPVSFDGDTALREQARLRAAAVSRQLFGAHDIGTVDPPPPKHANLSLHVSADGPPSPHKRTEGPVGDRFAQRVQQLQPFLPASPSS